jgi:hypothetical protein
MHAVLMVMLMCVHQQMSCVQAANIQTAVEDEIYAHAALLWRLIALKCAQVDSIYKVICWHCVIVAFSVVGSRGLLTRTWPTHNIRRSALYCNGTTLALHSTIQHC